MLNTCLVVLLVLATIALVSDLVPKGVRFWKWQKEYRYRRLVRKVRAELREFGPLWVIQEINNIAAVCTFVDFNRALLRWRLEIAKGEKPYWGTPDISVPNTFTFTGGGIEMQVATGTEGDFADIFTDLIYTLLGGKYDKILIRQHFKDFGRNLIKIDNRLFVPFIGSKWRPEWEGYRHTTLDQARGTLLHEVINQVRSRS